MKRFVTAAALAAALVVSEHLEAVVRADTQVGSTADPGPLLQARKVALIGETGKQMIAGDYQINQGAETVTLIPSIRVKKADGTTRTIALSEIVAFRVGTPR